MEAHPHGTGRPVTNMAANPAPNPPARPAPARRPRQLRASSIGTLMRLLSERGLSDDEIEHGIEYVEAKGAATMRQGFELAMSRVLFSDAQLAAGQRFTFDEAADGS